MFSGHHNNIINQLWTKQRPKKKKKKEQKQKGNDKLKVRGFRNKLNEGHWDQPLDCCLPNKVNEMTKRRWAY